LPDGCHHWPYSLNSTGRSPLEAGTVGRSFAVVHFGKSINSQMSNVLKRVVLDRIHSE